MTKFSEIVVSKEIDLVELLENVYAKKESYGDVCFLYTSVIGCSQSPSSISVTFTESPAERVRILYFVLASIAQQEQPVNEQNCCYFSDLNKNTLVLTVTSKNNPLKFYYFLHDKKTSIVQTTFKNISFLYE